MADGGGAGAGYNIPISVSYARTDTVNPVLSAGTVFNFSSPWGSGGTNDISSRPTSDATATSSAAEGNAASATQSAQSAGGDTTAKGAGSNMLPWLAVGALAILFFFKR